MTHLSDRDFTHLPPVFPKGGNAMKRTVAEIRKLALPQGQTEHFEGDDDVGGLAFASEVARGRGFFNTNPVTNSAV